MTKRMIVAPESKVNKKIELNEAESQAEYYQAQDRLKTYTRQLQTYEAKQQFNYPLERITESHIKIGNVKFPGADEAYPEATHALFRFVTYFFPHAKGGALYVDQPRNDQEVFRAYERHKVMKKLKIRHIVVERDSTFEHLLEQLGEL